jgi:hypothetical protein
LRRTLIPLLVAAAIAATAFSGAASAKTPAGGTYAYGTGARGAQIALRLGQAPADFAGGPTIAADGETVNVFVQDTLLAADPNARQHWADVLAGLLHGPELSQVTIYMATYDRVRGICGAGALGCYGENELVAIGQDVFGITAQSVVTHEYGHHIANNRINDPWPAVDWGTKRWSSYENVCQRAQAGQLAPGDEGASYRINPGEAFAEDYRVLNERRAGIPESAWQVVDSSLYPDQAALDALAQDVTSPWTQNTTTTYRVVLSGSASGRGFRLSTPLDGNFNVTLTSSPRERLTLRLVDLASGKVIASDSSALRVKTLGTAVCGLRSLQIQVKRVTGSGPFTLSFSKP